MSFETLLERFESEGIATRDSIRGCSASEIEALETKYELTVPSNYRRFLELMGHQAGSLFLTEDLEATYDDILRMTEEERCFAADDGESEQLQRILGDRALLIAGRLSSFFFYIRCDSGDDPAVRWYDNAEWETGEAYPSVLAFLEGVANTGLGE